MERTCITRPRGARARKNRMGHSPKGIVFHDGTTPRCEKVGLTFSGECLFARSLYALDRLIQDKPEPKCLGKLITLLSITLVK